MKEFNEDKLTKKLEEIRQRRELQELINSKCDVSLCFNLENSFSIFNSQISINCC